MTPEPPTFTDLAGVESDQLVIPGTPGVQYRLGGSNLDAGTYGKAKATGTVTVTSVAKPGYVFPVTGGLLTTWTHTFSAAGGVPFAVEDSSVSASQGGSLTTSPPLVSGQSGAISYAIDGSSALSALGALHRSEWIRGLNPPASSRHRAT